MYQQLQSYPTPFLWLKTPPRVFIEPSQAVFALQSLVLVLPLIRSVAEDFPPVATLGMESCNSIPNITPINRAVVEDFPPLATINLDSVQSILPFPRSIVEDFPPTGNLSLQSVISITPVIEVLPADLVNGGFSLQSVVA